MLVGGTAGICWDSNEAVDTRAKLSCSVVCLPGMYLSHKVAVPRSRGKDTVG